MLVYGECVLGKYSICYNEKIFAFKNSKNSRNLNFAKNKIKSRKEEVSCSKTLAENMDKMISTGDAKHCLIMVLPSVVAVADPVGGERQSDTESLRGEPEMQGF